MTSTGAPCLLYGKVEHTHNVVVLEANQGLCPLKESPHFFVIERDTKHFEGGSTVEIAVLPKIDQEHLC